MPPKKGRKSSAAKFTRTKRTGEYTEYKIRKRAHMESSQDSTLSVHEGTSDSGFARTTTDDPEHATKPDAYSDNIVLPIDVLPSPKIEVQIAKPTDLGGTFNLKFPSDEDSAIFTDSIPILVSGASKPLTVNCFLSSPKHETSSYHEDEALCEEIVSPKHETSSSHEDEALCEEIVSTLVSRPSGFALGEHSKSSISHGCFTRPYQPSTPDGINQIPDRQMEMPVSQFLNASLTEDISRGLQAVKAVLKTSLPQNWVPLLKGDGIHVGLLTQRSVFIVQRSLLFSVDGGIAATVHGQTLSESHHFWMNVENVALKTEDIQPFVQNILRVVSHLRSLEVCCGVDEFRSLWKTEKDSEVDHNLFQEMRHGEVLRARSCHMLIRCTQRKCSECSAVRRRLNERKIADDNRTGATPPSKKPDKYCNSAEKAMRSKMKSSKIESLRKENRRLRIKIGKLLQKEGVSLDHNTSSDLATILEHSEDDIGKLSYFQQVFVQQQVEAAKAKSPCDMRWHPAIVKLALSIRAKSGAAYEELSGVLSLPSQRTLFDYSHSMSTSGTVDTLEITDSEISSSSDNDN